MRRHLIAVALVIAIASSLAIVGAMRSGQRVRPPPSADSPLREESTPTQLSAMDDEVHLGDANASQSESPEPDAEVQSTMPRAAHATEAGNLGIRRYQVFVSREDGTRVEFAHVVLFRTTGNWSTYEVSELQTDATGRIDVRMKHNERFYLHSYKPGMGWDGSKGPPLRDLLVHDAYLTVNRMRIRCTGPYGYVRAGAVVEVTAELNISSSLPNQTWLKFPPRRTKTDDLGKCEMEGLPHKGSTGNGRTSMPGCRFTLTATWEGRTAQVKFDDFPKEEVQIVVE